MSHTKEEWLIGVNIHSIDIYQPDIGTIANIPNDLTSWRANAHLIAAAPDMYEALKLVQEHDGKLTGGDWKRIYDVICKAEGK